MNKYKRRRLLFLIPLIVIIIFLFNRLNPNLTLRKNYESYYPNKIEYLNKIDSQAYMIFNEIVYTASDDGIVNYEVSEGTKVPKDYKVATLSLTSDDDDLKKELMRVQAAIEYKNQETLDEDNLYQVSEEEANLITAIQNSFNSSGIKDTLLTIEALELNTTKNINISEISDLINLSNQELEDRKEELSREISTSNIVYEAGESGVISYKVDGLEDEFSKENINKITLDFLNSIDQATSSEIKNDVSKGDPLYKIIDNFEYYMALAVEDPNMVESFKIGEELEILIDETLSIDGEIVTINKDDDDKAVIVLHCTEKLMELGYGRKHDVSLIKDRINTYMVESNSLIEVDGQTGVYVEELNGLVNFVPVTIFLAGDENTLVIIGDENGNIELENGESSRTITIYDEILKNPTNIQEGQVIK